MNTKKEQVKLRKRKTKAGYYSLYLDTYDRGRRKYEYLRLYLIPERTKEDKRKNRETLQLAETIRAKRTVELNNGKYDIGVKQDGSVSLFDYYKMVMCNDIRLRMNTRERNQSILNRIREYEPRNITFAEVTHEWILGYKHFLDARDLKESTKFIYFLTLRVCINRAYKDGIISENPLRRISNYRHEGGNRMYLTLEEVQQLARTPCRDEKIKRAFLFSCLTGLRHSDVVALRWGDVHHEGNFTRIVYRQRKTNSQEYLDINEEARALMGERGADDESVFKLEENVITRFVIAEWVELAGINKHITFHCARHTFATMLLTLGTDLYTVSKLLGHKSIKTTEIYAKIIDKNKQRAVSMIPHILADE